MEWRSRNFASVHDAVNANTFGLADEFLHPRSDYVIPNAEPMAAQLKRLAKSGTPITIIGDYDTDGVCACAELYLSLVSAGAKYVSLRLPRRMSEGYGLNKKIVEEVREGAIVTVDNGIAAIDAVSEARKKGIPVYIIDHHLPVVANGQIRLPDADLIVDPKVPDEMICKSSINGTPYRDYCGAGLVCRIAGLLSSDPEVLAKISSLAAIATIADVVPLTGDNRLLYQEGMYHIGRGEVTAGLQAVIDLTKTGNILNESDIGFQIAPMLNAPGRLYDDGAAISLTAVLTQEPYIAAGYAQKLEKINEERKLLKENAVDRALSIMEEENLYGKNPIVIFDPQTPEGIVGLVAGELSEQFNASAFVLTQSRHFLKGSARSSGRDNVKEALDQVNSLRPDIFLGYGGHAQAAGVTVQKEKLSLFTSLMQEVMTPWVEKPDVLSFDMDISAGEIVKTAEDLQSYVPFGNGNPPIVFCVRNFKLVPDKMNFYREMKGNSVKLRGAKCEAVGFDLLDTYRSLNCPTQMDMVCSLGYHSFLGNVGVQAEILDLKLPERTLGVSSGFHRSIADALKTFRLG